MWQFAFDGLLAMGPAPQGTQPNQTGQMLQMLGTIAFFFVVMYFLMIRPQQKKAREHANMLKTLRRDDRVLTSGGIVGKVIGVKDRTVTLRSEEAKFEVMKSAVTEILERGNDENKAN